MTSSSHQPVPVKQTEILSLSSHQSVPQGGAIQSAETLPPATVENARTQLPEKRKLPAFPKGDISQDEGEAFCKLICDTYPEVFDSKKDHFRGAEATM